MNPANRTIIKATIVLAAINLLTNVWWVFRKNDNHLQLVVINIIVALLLIGIVLYIKK